MCESFVNKKLKLYNTINEVSDGNLIGIEQFFRVGTKYYIATKAVTHDLATIKEIADQPLSERIKVCCIVAHAFSLLHESGIVHSDVKPDNVLITKNNGFKVQIIDFDCSFFENDAPVSGATLNGDMVYLAPESFLFMIGENAEVTCKIDVFALGLLFHQYFTGSLPELNTEEYQYAYEAVLDSAEIKTTVESEPVNELIGSMLNSDPDKRPDMKTVFYTLKEYLLELLGRTYHIEENYEFQRFNEAQDV